MWIVLLADSALRTRSLGGVLTLGLCPWIVPLNELRSVPVTAHSGPRKPGRSPVIRGAEKGCFWPLNVSGG